MSLILSILVSIICVLSAFIVYDITSHPMGLKIAAVIIFLLFAIFCPVIFKKLCKPIRAGIRQGGGES